MNQILCATFDKSREPLGDQNKELLEVAHNDALDPWAYLAAMHHLNLVDLDGLSVHPLSPNHARHQCGIHQRQDQARSAKSFQNLRQHLGCPNLDLVGKNQIGEDRTDHRLLESTMVHQKVRSNCLGEFHRNLHHKNEIVLFP